MNLLLVEGSLRERLPPACTCNSFRKGSEIVIQSCEENGTILYGSAHGMKSGVIVSIVD